jgi:choline-sulfatase
MTARWESLGLLEAFRKDIKERAGKNTTLVRPSPLPLAEYYDVYVGQQAKNYLHNYKRSEPWFCWVSFAGPHEPWDTPEPYANIYRADDMPEPLKRPRVRDHGPTGELDRKFAESPGRIDNARELRASYAGKVTLIDDQIGQILKEIETRGELDRTVILFTSDHGEMNGDYGLIHKSNFLNPAVRIPLILLAPEMKESSLAGKIIDSPVELFDGGPTLSDFAGVKINYAHFARSLGPLLQDPNIEYRQFALAEFALEMMYLDQDWKLMLNRDGEPYRLFDVKKDPHEIDDLIGRKEFEAVIANLKSKLLDRRKQTEKV